jgi:hypothetical protein
MGREERRREGREGKEMKGEEERGEVVVPPVYSGEHQGQYEVNSLLQCAPLVDPLLVKVSSQPKYNKRKMDPI